ncbi:glycosyltransferase family 2 protein [Alishewanella tabrizica]|uniref:Glycosyltransferase 2-like domain-containing protein n=1 Tax=Alishewanella tabrizica TaxID=671278 RepID=A0ABQ2WC10_9ALTE|nr:glycosyltransferase [Alishewanella tabrizica]GGW48432.1 hypothetical protein GCM10008111_00030 [Alishewanella tabrizica]
MNLFSTASPPKLSILIPLYRSARFETILIENIRSHLSDGVEILISDQHCEDSMLAELQALFEGESSIRYFSSRSALNWVENINLLLNAARGEYVRILPHDDSSNVEASLALCHTLDQYPMANLAFGHVTGWDLKGNILPDKNSQPRLLKQLTADVKHDTDAAIDLFWLGSYEGAFKGVIRCKVIHQLNLFIIATPELIHSERLWLAALRLTGSFIYVDIEMLQKRYYSDSTHSQWRIHLQQRIASANVMAKYCKQILSNDKAKQAVNRNWFYCAKDYIYSERGITPIWINPFNNN